MDIWKCCTSKITEKNPLNLEMIPTISIPIKAWGKKREKEKQEEYTVELFNVFNLHKEKKIV